MEEEIKTEETQEVYKERPRWQIWGARILLVVFIAFLIMYYVNLMRGGR